MSNRSGAQTRSRMVSINDSRDIGEGKHTIDESRFTMNIEEEFKHVSWLMREGKDVSSTSNNHLKNE